jgi:peptidase E
MGGGGFSMEHDNTLLDSYILDLPAVKLPKICFIATASGDSQSYIESFYKFFRGKKCLPSHLSLFRGQTDKIEDLILGQDILYVGGGNTRNMLVLWKEWGVDKAIVKAYKKGVVLCGLSAGSICWFEEGLTDSVPNKLMSIECLGILSGSNCPHFDSESIRRETYKRFVKTGKILEGIATDDGCALYYVNEHLTKVISSNKKARAYRYVNKKGKLEETVITPEFLAELIIG